MDQNCPEYAESIQTGKRRSSLGALSKSKPVTKLKSMFEAKGSAPYGKESGLLGKLKPIYASHDASSFAAALSGSMGGPASLKMSVNGPLQHPQATPTAPLFSVLSAPVEPHVLSNTNPSRSVECVQISALTYQESLPDGGEVDAKLAKSPGSAGFLKRMSSSLKKALTSSTGKQKSDGFSPSYAGSDASNLSPRPSALLVMTPASQPSSVSLDLNCRSDQTHSAHTKSPSILMGYEFHSTRDYPEWARSCEANADIAPMPTSNGSRPQRSPGVIPPPSGTLPESAAIQHEAPLSSISQDVSARSPLMASPTQTQIVGGTLAAGAAADSFVNTDKGDPIGTAAHEVVGEESFAASLTACPTATDGREGPHGGPPTQEVNIGSALLSLQSLPSASNHASDIGADEHGSDLVFPSLLSAVPQDSTVHALEASASAGPLPTADSFGTLADASSNVDMSVCHSPMPAESSLALAADSDKRSCAVLDTSAASSSMVLDATMLQEPCVQQPVPLATRRSFSAAVSVNLDLSGAVPQSPDSPDTGTPTGEGNVIADSCIIGLTPIRPDLAALCVMCMDTPTLSTVAEDSPVASPSAASELPIVDLEDTFHQSCTMRDMDMESMESAPSGANATCEEDPAVYTASILYGGGDTATEEDCVSNSPALRFPTPVHGVPLPEMGNFLVPDTNMDWDDNIDKVPSAAGVSTDVPQKPASNTNTSVLPRAGPCEPLVPERVTHDKLCTAVAPPPAVPPAEPDCGCPAEPVNNACESPAHDKAAFTLQQPCAFMDEPTELAAQEPASVPLANELRVLAESLGLMESDDLAKHLEQIDTASEQVDTVTPDMASNTMFNDDMLCQAQEEMPADNPRSAEVEDVLLAGPVQGASKSSEDAPQQVDFVSSNSCVVSSNDGEMVAVVTEAGLLYPRIDSPLADPAASASPSAPMGQCQQSSDSGHEHEPNSHPGLQQVGEDVDMEDAEGVIADVLDATEQTTVALASRVDTIQLPGFPSPGDAQLTVAEPIMSSSPERSELQGDTQGAPAGDASSPIVVQLDCPAVKGTLSPPSQVVAEGRDNVSCGSVEMDVPGLSSSGWQLDLPVLDTVGKPQRQGPDADTIPQSLIIENSLAEVAMEIAGPLQVDSALTKLTITPAAAIAGAEGADFAHHAQPLAEKQRHAEPQMPSVEAADAANTLPDAPAEVSEQPIETETDLMDVDSSKHEAELPNVTPVPVDFYAAPKAGDAHADEVTSTSVEQPVSTKEAAIGATELIQPSPQPYPGSGIKAEARNERFPLQEGPACQELEQGLIACAAASTGLDGVPTAAAQLEPLGSPAIKIVPTNQILPLQSDLAAYELEPPDNQLDDPMMVSPMPQRLGMVPRAQPSSLKQALSQASPDISVSPGAQTSLSSRNVGLGVFVSLMDAIEEPEAATEILSVAPQGHLPLMGHHAPADTPDTSELPLQIISPIIGDMVVVAATPITTAEDFVNGSADPINAGNAMLAAGLPNGKSTTNVIAALPSVTAPSAISAGDDVSMADSLEAIEALWGNDDLLAEPGSATATSCVASSPVSTKHAELSQSGRKVASGVVLQVERESLDLFSLRNSCAARVSDSSTVESLDNFENTAFCTKSRAVGFVLMTPLKEGDEDVPAACRTSGSEGGSGPASTVPQTPKVLIAVHTGGSQGPHASARSTLPGSAPAGATGIPSVSRPAACSPITRAAHVSAASNGKVASAAKTATSGSASRANATTSTASKAMAVATTADLSASKPGVNKRSLTGAGQSPRRLSNSGQQAAGPTAPSPGSRLPGHAATPVATRTAVPTLSASPLMSSVTLSATPVATPGQSGVTPRIGGVFNSSRGQSQAAAVGRPGPFAQQPAPAAHICAGSGLFDTPLILRAAALPLDDTPFSGSDFDLDTADISAEASKAIAMLGQGDGSQADTGTADAVAQHTTPVLVPVRGTVAAGTPTLSILETHVQLLTSKLAEAEANIQQLQEENAMLRDQLSTLQFESSMTNDLDMERDARQFLEQELSMVRHRSDGLEADLRAAHAELKRREHAATELLASQQTKEAERARKEAEMELRMQQMASEAESASNFAQQADARIADAEARAAAATVKCDEETARSKELHVTLGLQAHQLVQVQRAREDAEAKFQRAMEQLITAQTSYKKAVVEYEQKLLQSSNLVSQINDVREKYRQMKQHAASAEQRAQHAEVKAQENTAALAKANMEKAELMQMCNELLTQLEAAKGKGGG